MHDSNNYYLCNEALIISVDVCDEVSQNVVDLQQKKWHSFI